MNLLGWVFTCIFGGMVVVAGVLRCFTWVRLVKSQIQTLQRLVIQQDVRMDRSDSRLVALIENRIPTPPQTQQREGQITDNEWSSLSVRTMGSGDFSARTGMVSVIQRPLEELPTATITTTPEPTPTTSRFERVLDD